MFQRAWGKLYGHHTGDIYCATARLDTGMALPPLSNRASCFVVANSVYFPLARPKTRQGLPPRGTILVFVRQDSNLRALRIGYIATLRLRCVSFKPLGHGLT
jgi:hypothetical protein